MRRLLRGSLALAELGVCVGLLVVFAALTATGEVVDALSWLRDESKARAVRN